MRRFLVIVRAILVVAGLGLGGYVGYRAFALMGKDDTGQLQSYLVLAVLALLLVVAAGVVRPRADVEPPVVPPAPQRRPPYPPGGYRPPGPATGAQPRVGPVTGPPTGPITGQQPPAGGPDQPYGRHEY